MENLNKEYYSKVLLEPWALKTGIIPAEKHLLEKYVVDTNKSVLEAGTGGGRLAFYIEDMGFKNISAFDIVPEMIRYAHSIGNRKGSSINFQVADASLLSNYQDNAFEYLIYLQQILCFVPQELLFQCYLEAFRVAKKGGTVIFSFLDWNSKIYNPLLSWMTNIFRRLRNEKVLKQYLPWLKLNGKINWSLFNKRQAQIYWGNKHEIISDLEKVGFSIIEAKNANQLFNSKSIQRKGMLYIVCKK